MLQGKASYLKVLRNRNMILTSLVMMVGGAGRGLTVIFLAQHFRNDLGLSTMMVSVAVTAMLAGGVIGPVGFGWISDWFSRIKVIQASLFLSTLATLWLAFQGAFLPLLLANLVLYGTVIRSRMTLTLALVADSLAEEDRDAAFSVFSFLGSRLRALLDYANRASYGRARFHSSLLNYIPILSDRDGSDAVCGRSSRCLPGGGIPSSGRRFVMKHFSPGLPHRIFGAVHLPPYRSGRPQVTTCLTLFQGHDYNASRRLGYIF